MNRSILLAAFLALALKKAKSTERSICCECGEPIHAEGEMEGEVQYVTRDGVLKPIHEDCRYENVPAGVIAGRIIPHGGCGDPS